MAISGITGLEKLLRNIEKAKQAARKGAEKGVERARLAVQTTAKKKIQRGPKTGLWYGKHQASAPGEPPATDTGTLVRSIESKREELTAWVWTEEAYGKFLEFGTRHIAPRPWLTPAVEENRERFPVELGKAVVESIDGAVKA
jgi:HK97 gp10 family phage protein